MCQAATYAYLQDMPFSTHFILQNYKQFLKYQEMIFKIYSKRRPPECLLYNSSIYELLCRDPKGKRSSVSDSSTVYQTAFTKNQLMKNSVNYLCIVHNTIMEFMGRLNLCFMPKKQRHYSTME